ncbi:alpha/beta hydrolase [Loigolactobacillus jiayinensis]|mgnify:CR=1 FL=1|uniref:Alpha/beta hydrolase n=1 Tax=Loigolactobacillus jiayinensis TaxID=2486016 RepID=A0ABW1RCX7_9LACO|nr:alpha/beta hydrolase [Loigolactobacillus jiayinensis]
MNKATRRLLTTTLVGSAGFLLGSYLTFQGSTMNYKKASRKQRDIDFDGTDPWALEKKWYQTQPREPRQITTADGLTLQAIMLRQPQATTKVAVLAHGYHHSWEQMAPYAKLFFDLGFNVLVPDARGHGDSDGHTIGFGWLDRKDYVQWAQLMTQEFGSSATLVLFGISMGAATVMAASGEANLPTTVKAVIEDSGFSSVVKEVGYRAKTRYNIPHFFIPMTALFAKQQAGYSYYQGDILKQLLHSKTPTLFIHGGADSYVPPQAFHTLYNAATMPKMAYFVPQADHIEAYLVNRARYEQVLRQFLTKLGLIEAPASDEA